MYCAQAPRLSSSLCPFWSPFKLVMSSSAQARLRTYAVQNSRRCYVPELPVHTQRRGNHSLSLHLSGTHLRTVHFITMPDSFLLCTSTSLFFLFQHLLCSTDVKVETQQPTSVFGHALFTPAARAQERMICAQDHIFKQAQTRFVKHA